MKVLLNLEICNIPKQILPIRVSRIRLGIFIVLQILKPLTIRPSYFSNQSLTNLKIYEDFLSNPIILLIPFNKSYYLIQISSEIILSY